MVIVIGLLFIIDPSCPPSTRPMAYDASALSAGRSAKEAVEYYYKHHKESGGLEEIKTGDILSELLIEDRNLTDDVGVTFVFTVMSNQGFTFTTTHSRGKKTFIYSNDVKMQP